MAFDSVLDWITRPLLQHSGLSLHRQILVISAEHAECMQRTKALLDALEPVWSCCALSQAERLCSNQQPISHYRRVLGQEYDLVVYDAFGGFRPNALLAIAGTLKRSGTLVLLCPPTSVWPSHQSLRTPHFLSFGRHISASRTVQEFARTLSESGYVSRWDASELSLALPMTAASASSRSGSFASEDQARVYGETLEAFAEGVEVVTLSAARGRGKSTLLGLLAHHFALQGRRVLLTSPLQESVQSFFAVLEGASEGFTQQGAYCFVHQQTKASIEWVAPDNPKLEEDGYQLLLVDEAAALPLPVLKKLCRGQAPVLLSTTTSGYEGSGQGFVNRFIPWLHSHYRVNHYDLYQPVRWTQGDVVEALLDRTLNYLSAEPPIPTPDILSKPLVTMHSFASLPSSQLSEIMQLLRTAHYQTTPDDMMRLIDSPDNFCFLLTCNSQILGAAAINVEGGCTLAPVAGQIASGQRRVKGHLGAQSLTLASATAEIAMKTYWRVNRIAIAPTLQQRGYGSLLLKHVIGAAKFNGIDALLSSFGMTPTLLHFWQKSGFNVLKFGYKADKSSGLVSVLTGLTCADFDSEYFSRLALFDRRFGLPGNTNPAEFTTIESCASEDFDDNLLHCRRLQQFIDGSRSIEQLGGSGYWWIKQCVTKPQTETPDFFMLQDAFELRMGESALMEKYAIQGRHPLYSELRQRLQHYFQELAQPAD